MLPKLEDLLTKIDDVLENGAPVFNTMHLADLPPLSMRKAIATREKVDPRRAQDAYAAELISQLYAGKANYEYFRKLAKRTIDARLDWASHTAIQSLFYAAKENGVPLPYDTFTGLARQTIDSGLIGASKTALLCISMSNRMPRQAVSLRKTYGVLLELYEKKFGGKP